MALVTRSCHGPNGRFTLSCAGSVFGTELMPYFVNSTFLVSKSVIRRYITVNFKVKVNLGPSSCYFDLRSNFQLDISRSKIICFDASWKEKQYVCMYVLTIKSDPQSAWRLHTLRCNRHAIHRLFCLRMSSYFGSAPSWNVATKIN